MHRVSLFLHEAQEAGLESLRERDGVPAAESIRRAIDAYLKQKGVSAQPKKGKAKR